MPVDCVWPEFEVILWKNQISDYSIHNFPDSDDSLKGYVQKSRGAWIFREIWRHPLRKDEANTSYIWFLWRTTAIMMLYNDTKAMITSINGNIDFFFIGWSSTKKYISTISINNLPWLCISPYLPAMGEIISLLLFYEGVSCFK